MQMIKEKGDSLVGAALYRVLSRGCGCIRSDSKMQLDLRVDANVGNLYWTIFIRIDRYSDRNITAV